jgi:DNA-binding response OmpR family regulator
VQAVVVSSNAPERDLLVYALRQAGVTVVSSGDYMRMLSNWEDHPADILIISINKEENPIEVTQEVRKAVYVPLLIIGDFVTEQAMIDVLQSGADYLLDKPVSPLLVSAQTLSILRRANTVPVHTLPVLDLGAIKLDPSTRTVMVGGSEPRRLTQLEFRLLYTFMINRGQILPADTIVEKVWGYEAEGNRELVRGLVSRLRHKIEPNPEKPIFLETHPGIGYRFILLDEE